MPGTLWRNVAGYVTFDVPKCQGTLARTLTCPAKKIGHMPHLTVAYDLVSRDNGSVSFYQEKFFTRISTCATRPPPSSFNDAITG
jgi:hypothetical protein